ncbi:MAG TPA: hypothetical protein VKF37_05680 [Chloroflexota bacterium]|nr:hypothetical protein [Chloroflexota bacterium]
MTTWRDQEATGAETTGQALLLEQAIAEALGKDVAVASEREAPGATPPSI